MFDHGLHLTLQAIRRQVAAMPHDLYLIRLIHSQTRRAFPGERLWTAGQLSQMSIVRFLRIRNREGCDVYIQPYADKRNPGYIFVDLDEADPSVIETMQAEGHEPCVVLQTSPGHLQAWVHVCDTAIEPAVANCIGRHLAQLYSGDPASTDWRHLGRLAGFTNQKPQRRNRHGEAPWVKVLYSRAGLAAQGAALLETARNRIGRNFHASSPSPHSTASVLFHDAAGGDAASAGVADAVRIYVSCLHRLRILERFSQPDWSIADKWIAKDLLLRGTLPPQVAAVLRGGSPGFPRRHSNPDDYLRRTLARAAGEIEASSFPRRDLLPYRSGHTDALS